eukprot:TRINITY_DN61680_c0_g1_i1.p1 TRINITY_DN61680_c0_g1~~TRINITY_DN61680_c0_g1_i1.p1  ORF type:complete len:619 (-),score=319.40 TRINITY_DN61680_c0_g1_i1:179-1954(-)
MTKHKNMAHPDQVQVSPKDDVDMDRRDGDPDIVRSAPSKCRRCAKISLVGVLFVAIAAVVVVTQGCLLGINCSKAGMPVTTRFISVGGAASSGGAARRLRLRRLLDSAVSAAAVDVQVEELSYAIGTVKLCEKSKLEWYDYEGSTYVMYTPDHDTCVEVVNRGEQRTQHGVDECAVVGNKDAAFVNFADQADLDAKLKVTSSVPIGTYKFAEVTFARYVRFRASVMLSNGTITQRVYTKKCGVGTCGSVCQTADNLRECRGLIPSGEKKGTTAGQTNSLGDIWRWSNFTTTQDGISGTDPTGYWARCDYDMTEGPAETIYTRPKNDNDAIVIEFTEPLDVTQNSTLGLQLTASVDGAVQGKLKPYNDQVGGLAPTMFYDVTDGLYGISLASLTLAPIITHSPTETVWRYEYRFYVRKSSVPICMNGTEAFGKDGVPRGVGKCHPCHLWEFQCERDGKVLNDEDYAVANSQVSQDFDLKVDLFYVSNRTDGSDVDVLQPRTGSVNKMYNSSYAVTREIPFFLMRVERITRNSWDATTINLEENLFGKGRFPRIRDVKLLSAVGQRGTAKIMLEDEVFYEIDTELVSIQLNGS